MPCLGQQPRHDVDPTRCVSASGDCRRGDVVAALLHGAACACYGRNLRVPCGGTASRNSKRYRRIDQRRHATEPDLTLTVGWRYKPQPPVDLRWQMPPSRGPSPPEPPWRLAAEPHLELDEELQAVRVKAEFWSGEQFGLSHEASFQAPASPREKKHRRKKASTRSEVSCVLADTNIGDNAWTRHSSLQGVRIATRARDSDSRGLPWDHGRGTQPLLYNPIRADSPRYVSRSSRTAHLFDI